MTRFDDIAAKAKFIQGLPDVPTAHRKFPCARCGRDIGRSVWICDGCQVNEKRTVRDMQLLRARESVPIKFRTVRFGSPEMASRVKGTQFAVAAARKALEGARSVVTIIGAAGSGKTTLACAMLAEVIEAGADLNCAGEVLERARFARFVDAVDLSQARQEHRLGAAAPPIVLGAKNASLLVVDEFGRDDRKTLDVAKIVHDREAAKRLTVVTTWMDQAQIAAAYDGGVSRRLFEKATVIRLGAQ